MADGQFPAVLGHLAFWDLWILNRWQRFARTDSFDQFPDSIVDLLNSALELQWLALLPVAARDLAAAAAKHLMAEIEGLSDAAMSLAINTGRSHMIDRSRHWNEHMTQVRRSLA